MGKARFTCWIAVAAVALLASPPAAPGVSSPAEPSPPAGPSLRPGSALPAGLSAETQACGRSGCHPQAVAEWASSSHRFSGLDDPWYLATFAEAQSAVGPRKARWCAGCHIPALVLAGRAERPARELAADPLARTGVSCTICHSISHLPSLSGGALFELAPPPSGSGVFATGGWRRALFDLRTRLSPGPHRRMFASPPLGGAGAAEACMTCHRGSVDAALNGHGWLSVFDDVSPWQGSEHSGQTLARSTAPLPARDCLDCHMARVSSRDAGNRAGWAHSHRFAAANTALPALRGDREQLAAVRESLSARQVTVDLFALTVERGGKEEERAPLNRLSSPLRRGASVQVRVVVRNRGVGHLFPGGKQDLHDCWLELAAVDDRGRVLFQNGRADEGSPVDRDAHPFDLVWIDEQGEAVPSHRVWTARASSSPHLVEAGGVDLVAYEVAIPRDAGNTITLSARLHYRPLKWEFTRAVFSSLGSSPPRLPIVTLAEDSVTLPLAPADADLPAPAPPVLVAADAERWIDYGLALTAQGLGSQDAFQHAVDLRPDDPTALVRQGGVALDAGDFPASRAKLLAALRLAPGFSLGRFFLARLERQEAQYDRAIEELRVLARHHPRDIGVRRELATCLLLTRQFAEARGEIQAVLAVNPEDGTSHLLAAQISSALGDQQGARAEREQFNRYRGDPQAMLYMLSYFQKHAEGNTEMGPHQHRSLPLAEPTVPGAPGRP